MVGSMLTTASNSRIKMQGLDIYSKHMKYKCSLWDRKSIFFDFLWYLKFSIKIYNFTQANSLMIKSKQNKKKWCFSISCLFALLMWFHLSVCIYNKNFYHCERLNIHCKVIHFIDVLNLVLVVNDNWSGASKFLSK